MKRKLVWGVVGVLVLTLALVTVSCGGAAPAPAEQPAEKPAGEEPVQKPAEPVKGQPVQKPAEEPAKEEPQPAAGPPPIPHSLVGRDDCLMCHGTGALKPFPADHAGRTNATCTACHQPAG